MTCDADVRLVSSPLVLVLDIAGTNGRIKRIEADPTNREGLDSVYRRLVALENEDQITGTNSSDAMSLVKKHYDYSFTDYLRNNGLSNIADLKEDGPSSSSPYAP
jgi:hypothetical protein